MMLSVGRWVGVLLAVAAGAQAAPPAGVPKAERPAPVPDADRRPPVGPAADRPDRAFGLDAVIWPDDVKLSGRHLAGWTDKAGESVLLYKGDFKYEVWRFKAESRDAVVWVRAVPVGNDTVHLLTVYLEGRVEITEPDGGTQKSDRFLVTHATRGDVRRSYETLAAGPVEEDGVYIRGRAARSHKKPEKKKKPGDGDPKDGDKPKDPKDPDKPEDPAKPEDPEAKAPRPDGEPEVILPPQTVQKVMKRVLFGRADVEVLTRGDQIMVVLDGYRPREGEPGKGPEPVRVNFGDLEMVADHIVLFTNRRLLEKSEPGPKPAGSRAPDIAEGAYLEGDVQVNSGLYNLRASRLYYDFGTRSVRSDSLSAGGPAAEKAIVRDAVLRAYDEIRNVPLYMRASELQLLSRNDIVAENAELTTSDFNPPHYSIGARRLHLWDLAMKKIEGTGKTRLQGYFEATDAVAKLRSVPVFYLPWLGGDNDPRPESFRNFRFGRSNRLGNFLTTQWYLWHLLGVDAPIDGLRGVYKLDYYTKRGPATGVDLDWEYERSFGQVRSTLMYDNGTDRISNAVGDTTPPEKVRGRLLARYRKYFDADEEKGITPGWELTTEFSYISDRNYLLEFNRFEARDEKEQETLAYLKKKGLLNQENWAFTLQLQPRLLSWLAQVERLPEVGFYGIGDPVGGFATSYNDTRAGLIQLRVASFPPVIDPTTGEELPGGIKPLRSDLTGRATTRQEFTAPFALGPVNFVPYVAGRVAGYSDSPRDDALGRAMGHAGIRASTSIWAVNDEISSRMLDLHKLRHIMTPELNAWVAGTNVQPDRLFVFDHDIEAPGAQSGLQLALRNVLQTKRGGPDHWTVVDWMFLDVEAGFFQNREHGFDISGVNQYVDPVTGVSFPFVDLPDGTGGIYRGQNVWYRPENSLPRNHAAARFGWRATEVFSILADAHMDLDTRNPPVLPKTVAIDTGNNGLNSGIALQSILDPLRNGPYLDSYGIGIAMDRSPRWSAYIGYRHVAQLDLDVVAGNLSYRINEKYGFSTAANYDARAQKFVRARLNITRRLPRFIGSLGFDWDQTRDNPSFFVNLAPEGFETSGSGTGFR
jgi:hypothetical protein